MYIAEFKIVKHVYQDNGVYRKRGTTLNEPAQPFGTACCDIKKKYSNGVAGFWYTLFPMRPLLFAFAIFSVVLFAQAPEGGRGRGPKAAPKNLKVLSPDGLMDNMRMATAGLG